MPNQKLGVTANELFACNPFRILGLPVNAEDGVIETTYKRLLTMAASGKADSFKTDYDQPSLPPFRRDEPTLRNAYAKLASNGYRAFAFADGIFSQSLNIDDVMLNLNDITCYDCFLRIYMWLICNDRDFEEPELWVPLAKYIDQMINSSPAQWAKYFDDRFAPTVMAKAGAEALEEFHATFKDIILLPIKEMVRGSMRCTSAVQILSVAKVDVNEVFPKIDIPQANKPAPGQPAPKLKIAVKEGEEYFDVTQGKMVSFDSQNDSAVESNDFAAASSAISAASILEEEKPEPAPAPKPAPVAAKPEPKEEHRVSLVDDAIAASASASTPSKEPVSRPVVDTSAPAQEEPAKPVEAIDTLSRPTRAKPAPKPAEKPVASAPASQELDLGLPSGNPSGVTIVGTDPDNPRSPKYEGPAVYYAGGSDLPSANVGERSLEAVDPFAMDGASSPKPAPKPSTAATTRTVAGTPHKRSVTLTGMDGLADEASTAPELDFAFTAPAGTRPAAPEPEVVEEKVSNVTERRTLSSILDDIETRTDETTEALLEKQEEDEALYTDTLVKLLRSSANSNKRMMKGVDTTHAFDNGDASAQGPATKGNITMDELSLKGMDESRLDAAYDGARTADESHAKQALQAKYRKKASNVTDMLNPTLGARSTRGFAPDAIQEYKKEKAAEKKFSQGFAKFLAFMVFVAVVVGLLIFLTSG